MFARIGGEGFAVIMPATNLEGSRQVAEDFQKALTNTRMPIANAKEASLA